MLNKTHSLKHFVNLVGLHIYVRSYFTENKVRLHYKASQLMFREINGTFMEDHTEPGQRNVRQN